MKAHILIMVLLLIPFVSAHDDPHPPEEVGESIVNLELSCEELTDEQVLAVGIYLYGEHPWPWWTRLKTRIGYCWGK